MAPLQYKVQKLFRPILSVPEQTRWSQNLLTLAGPFWWKENYVWNKANALVIVNTFPSCRSKRLACLGFAFSWFVVTPTKNIYKTAGGKTTWCGTVWSNNIALRLRQWQISTSFTCNLLLSCNCFHGWHVMWAFHKPGLKMIGLYAWLLGHSD